MNIDNKSLNIGNLGLNTTINTELKRTTTVDKKM